MPRRFWKRLKNQKDEPLEPPAVEKEVGMEVYLTSSPGVGGRLRISPEDFIVEELSLPPPRVEGGGYIALRAQIRNWETNRLVRELARCVGISRHRIGFAGTKDKRGVKVQFFTVLASMEQVGRISLGDFEVLEAYPTDRPLELGQLLGNRFDIRLRGATGEGLPAALASVSGELASAGGFPNFFGIQRFGALRPVTHVVGERMVRGDIEGAVMAYLGGPVEAESEPARLARTRLENERDFAAAAGYFPRHLGFERSLIHHLQVHPGDWAGALRQLPPNLLMMFVHAYQSALFNRILSQRIREGMPLLEPETGDIVLPADILGRPDHDHHILVEGHNLERVREKARSGKAFVSGVLFGSDSSFSGGRMGEMERKVVEEEGLRPEDFLVPEIPEVSSKGTRRELLVRFPPGEPDIVPEDEAIRFRFSLPRGCYATALLREYMKGEVLDY
jgi:tRNA pseudouridine13 synthase